MAFYVAAPRPGRIAGTWVSDSDSGLVEVEALRDGTFVQYENGQEISRGRWKLNTSYQIFGKLELDDSYRLPVWPDDLQRGKGAMAYSLLHRAGKLCLKTGKDPAYWCKVK
ncbi:MAG: hypothetical protein ABSF16_10770 [Terracidiphilus sp.]|jgi:hypothetical protein